MTIVRDPSAKPDRIERTAIREEFLDRLFRYLNEHLDESVKKSVSSQTLKAVMGEIADFYLKERSKMALEVARDLTRPKARITSEHDNPTPEDFLNALGKL